MDYIGDVLSGIGALLVGIAAVINVTKPRSHKKKKR